MAAIVRVAAGGEIQEGERAGKDRSDNVAGAAGRAVEVRAPAPLLEELVISFTDVHIVERRGRRRAAARFRLEHRPARGSASSGEWQEFESPLGPPEIEEIRWYLEGYPGWPFGTFRKRATALEAKLPKWGRALYDRTLGRGAEQTSAWRRASGQVRRVVVEVDEPGALAGAGQGTDRAGAASLLALPWELLSDREGYLFEGSLGAGVVRRTSPRGSALAPPPAKRLRLLLVIARPAEEGVSFLGPRESARPLVEALAALGYRAELEVLGDGTFPALREALARADKEGRPFHAVHFDGHVVYDARVGLGMLCFENPTDAAENKLERRADLVDAERVGSLLRERQVPLFVLEAYQTANPDETATTSVAGSLLGAGVGSVLAMTYSVQVETARRFKGRFYAALAAGERIGNAIIEAEHHLRVDPRREKGGGGEELELQDWFVPVLFQREDGDSQLLEAGPTADLLDLAAERRAREGELPEAPAHGFVGRSRELLALQRRLRDERCLAVLGEGGQGKTALVAECARWLLDLRRFESVAFASVEDLPGPRLLLQRLGWQLVPGYSVAQEEGTGTAEERLARARLPVERMLAERRVLLVVDDLESVLAAPDRQVQVGLDETFALLAGLAQRGATRLLLTSREALPAPLDGPAMRLGRLSSREGRELVAGVLARAGRAPAGDADEKQIDELIETVGGHARALVLLAPLVAEQGLQVTAVSVARAMRELEVRLPEARELSLLASVRLSLNRLPAPARRQARALAVFHRAAHVVALARVLEVEPEEARALGRQLLDLGLADARGPYLFPNQAVGAVVADELSGEERRALEERWFAAMLDLIRYLYQMLFPKSEMATEGVQASLTDFLAALATAEEKVEAGELTAEAAMSAVTDLQQLVNALGRPAVLARLEEMRRRLARRLGEWSHAAFAAAHAEVEKRLGAGDLSGAVQAAERLKERAEVAIYADSAYDRAVARLMLGRTLTEAGRAPEALSTLREAEQDLTELAGSGNESAARMLSVVFGERGDALRRLGRLDEAAESHQRALEVDERWGDLRSAAVSRVQLGAVRLLQGRLRDALDAYEQARQTFEGLHEPQSVAVAWHQLGRVHEEARRWDLAEVAYQNSLRIEAELGDKSGQALTLGQLGVLYGKMGRLEQSAQLHRKAAILGEELGDAFSQARALINLASAFWALGRLDEAREAATQAARLQAPFGHAAEPWRAWALLEGIETIAGRLDAAAAAHSRAMELYASYRRDGGAPMFSAARLIAAAGEALREQGAEEARRLIPPPEKFDEELRPAREALLAIVDGSRDPALAADPRLDYVGAVELSLLLGALGDSKAGPS
ncbi:MAG TPA: tetratricopeptide repeat protein [Thermoanaerobaculia bacterium]|nr:tetratricopeptide repeat protein [Thermoanaerobaculia bacterium]